jgi:hypothetical protein
VRRLDARTSYIASATIGAYGVEPSWPNTWTAFSSRSQFTVTRLTSTTSNYQYQLCFKCHSYYAYTSSPPRSPSLGATETDQAFEFNPKNASYHAVAGASKASSYGAYRNGWTYTSRMSCTDCHNNDTTPTAGPPIVSSGPHGSGNRSGFVLRNGSWSTTVTPDNYTTSVCYNCHDLSAGTGFWGGGLNHDLHFSTSGGGMDVKHRYTPCVNCHTAIPHGYNRRHLIVYVSAGAPYYQDNGQGLTSYTPNDSKSYVKGSCGTTSSCH